MNNTGLELRLRDKVNCLTLDGSNIPSTLDSYEIACLECLNHDDALVELLEHYLCNGWEVVTVVCFGGMVLKSPNGVLYRDMYYDTENAVEKLLEGGVYYFYKVYDDYE